MMKTLFVGVWVCIVMLGASFGFTTFLQSRAKTAAPAALVVSETRKTKEINIPIIRDGGVKGYVVAQFSYVVDVGIAGKLTTQPDPFVVDEAFRYIYDDEKIDFAHLDHIELDKMTRTLIVRINQRLKSDVITEMGVIECNFLLNAEGKPKT
jgi:hypothetical protein